MRLFLCLSAKTFLFISCGTLRKLLFLQIMTICLTEPLGSKRLEQWGIIFASFMKLTLMIFCPYLKKNNQRLFNKMSKSVCLVFISTWYDMAFVSLRFIPGMILDSTTPPISMLIGDWRHFTALVWHFTIRCDSNFRSGSACPSVRIMIKIF